MWLDRDPTIAGTGRIEASMAACAQAAEMEQLPPTWDLVTVLLGEPVCLGGNVQ